MKEALAFIGILTLAVSLWLLKGHSDKKIIDSKNETIKSLQEVIQLKEDSIVKDNAVLDLKSEMIKSLQNAVQSKEDIIVKNNALLDSENSTIKSLKDAIQIKEDIIAKNNAVISAYQDQLAKLSKKENRDKDEDRDNRNVYPDDNGFDAQDLGSGFFSYQYFGKKVVNPYDAPEPDRDPNHTPWTFSGNAGIAANNSGFYVNNATNRDSTGATSTNGQAGFLQFKDSSISQLVTLPAGTYTVTFDYEARRDYCVNQIAVSIDKTVLFKGAPTSCTNFKRVTTSLIFLAASGKHQLMFRGLGGIGDTTGDTTFIDNISLNRISSRIPDSNMNDAKVDLDHAHGNGTAPAIVESPK